MCVSEVVVPTEKLKEMVAVVVLGMSMNVNMNVSTGINRVKESRGE